MDYVRSKSISFSLLYCFCLFRYTIHHELKRIKLNTTSLMLIQATYLEYHSNANSCNSTEVLNSSDYTSIFQSFKSRIPLVVPQENWTMDTNCFGKCSCDLAECVERGTCCVDLLNADILQSKIYNKLKCSSAQLRPLAVNVQSGFAVWMIRECADGYITGDDFQTEYIKERCEHPENFNTLDTLIPVSDTLTNITYQNRYCMVCNTVSDADALYWTASIKCTKASEARFLYNINKNDLIKEIMGSKTCNLIYEIPDGTTFVPQYCVDSLFKSCNVTGYWTVYDSFIETACHAYTSNFFQTYNNIFCYMCNVLYWPDGCPSGGSGNIFPLFTTLLKYNPSDFTDTDHVIQSADMCTNSQMLDSIKNICRNISCRFPKKERNGQCVNLVDKVAGLEFILYLKLTPQRTINEADVFGMINPLLAYIYQNLQNWRLHSNIYNFTLLYKVDLDAEYRIPATPGLPPPPLPTLAGDAEDRITPEFPPPPFTSPPGTIATHPFDFQSLQSTTATSVGKTGLLLNKNNESINEVLPTDSFSLAPPTLNPNVNSPVATYILFRIGIYFSSKVDSLNTSFINDVLDADGDNVTVVNANTGSLEVFKLTMLDLSSNDFTTSTDVDIKDTMNRTSLININGLYPIKLVRVDDEVGPIVITKSLTCPLVEMGPEENDTVGMDPGSVYIYGHEIDLRYIYLDETELEDGTKVTKVFVCKEIVERILEKSSTKSTDNRPITVKEIFSFVTVCLSVTCALLTFLTYCLFTELRTQPGLNNMGLVFSLIVAQVLFQFGVNQADKIPAWACQTIGILVHFFWLNVIFWMNICSIHMFKVFSNLQTIRPRNAENNMRTTCIYSIYCLTASLIFVAINVAVMATTSSNNADFGYGGSICYISRLDMMGYLFGLPVLLVVLVNICLFVTVVIKISRLPSIASSRKSERNFLAIYSKLASVTGITWIAGFMYYFTNFQVCEYIFILFNAGQGVLIFVSFICNKRVLCLYKTFSFGKKSYIVKDVSYLATKQTAVTNEGVTTNTHNV